MQGSIYTDEQRLQAVSAYAITGNLTEVSKLTGIPKQTLSEWKCNSDWWGSLLGQARIENKDRMLSVFTAILDKATSALIDRLENGDPILDSEGRTIGYKPVSARDLGVISGISHDKMALIAGDPTSRVEKVTTEQRLERLTAKFREVASASTQPTKH